MKNNKILVTKTFLPPVEEYISFVKRIWENRWLTNNGPFALEVEEKLKELLDVKHVFFVSNGTSALQMALKALDITGEVITTPFTFVATSNAIIWEKCTPVFVDIEPDTFSIDPSKIEAAITDKTQAILAVHIYGYPAQVTRIEAIAKKYNLKVIYDAAHAFGVKINGKSILNYGDISAISLHATKLFHTGEGGLVTTNDDHLARRINRLRNFGYENEDILEAGINMKNSELHAALGLTNLKYLPYIISNRRKIVEKYKSLLEETGLNKITYENFIAYNYSYFPVVFENERQLLKVKEKLEEKDIFPRRYFYPSLNTLPFVPNSNCPVSESISKRVLCLPLYHDLAPEMVNKIAGIIKNTLDQSKPTLAVGIPAHNEEGNIIQIINSVSNQQNNNYTLKEIIINSDSSSDKTVSLVKKIAKKDQRIILLDNKERKGKAYRLNEIYGIHNSDYLLTLDGDVLLKDPDVIDKMMQIFFEDKKACLVAAHLVPIKPGSFIGKIIYTNDILWNAITIQINDGDHIANLYGAASLLKKNFSKSFTYPAHIICDEEYLYIKAKEKNGFRYAKNAHIFFMAPATLKEVILQGRRALKERYVLVEIFGNDILKLHEVPLKIKIKEVFKMITTNPFYTTLSLLLMIFLRIIPYQDTLNNNGMWQIAASTKNINKYS